VAVPLISRDEVLGTLTADSDRPNAFNQSDIQLMTVAAAQVSIALANARLYEELEDRATKLSVAYNELKESDKLKDELVQNVSHELRTPLTFVRGYIELLLDGEMGLTNPDQQHALQIVADKTAEITRLVDDIMSLQRIEATNLALEQFSIVRLVEEVVSCHQLSADRKGIALNQTAGDKLGLMVGDRGRINQVLDNLVNNAIKFSPNGGVVTLDVQENGDSVTVSVSDQGIGVPGDKLERIFDRFYQVDGSARRRFGGTGIGLAIVKRIIEVHHGRIWAQSTVEKGSTFFFTLPKAQVSPSRSELHNESPAGGDS
jgi:signal transduction histidine kinase